MKDQAAATTTFLNPSFAKPHHCKENIQKHRASNLSYMAISLVSSARLAFENETSGIAMEQRGISETLGIAEAIIGDLIDQVEGLERGQATETAQ